jgi:hypothetical protein
MIIIGFTPGSLMNSGALPCLALKLFCNNILTIILISSPVTYPSTHAVTHLGFPVCKPVRKLGLHPGNTHVHLLKSYYSSRPKPNAICSMKILFKINLYLPCSPKTFFVRQLIFMPCDYFDFNYLYILSS